MNGKRITRVFLVVIIAAIALFDIIIMSKYGKQASVSWIIISEAKTDYPLINDAFFITIGHLFWRMKTPKLEVK